MSEPINGQQSGGGRAGDVIGWLVLGVLVACLGVGATALAAHGWDTTQIVNAPAEEVAPP